MSLPDNTYSLVADIGGTNTRVALADGRQLLTETVTRYRNAEFPGLETVLRKFLADHDDVDCKGACVAIAGPVKDGRGELTNLNWEIDETTISRAAKADNVRLLNDLQAQGHSIGHLAHGSVTQLLEGHDSPPEATKLVIGVGTGFNIAPVFETPAGRLVTPSESGHANLPIRSEAELRLIRYFETAHGFPAVEDMLSGRGLERVYTWLCTEGGAPAEKNAQTIVADFESGSDPRAVEAARMFVRMLGTVAGNLTLIQLPFGGVYFAGGVARAFTPHFASLGFAEAFRDKGRFSGFMQNFSVHVIEDDYAALTGCATCLMSGT
ncbi:glucokinase [Litoreibacter roseus]|uniref:Glucokinase n=1 Tax=Litoreibacter roseus TaxID=2601869 RepID=A0A6N6JD18_9RHOB|nr:glucokinase [Litoreibacter roseus]GFE64243.1 glucokinase [Litoreibacter roseus]